MSKKYQKNVTHDGADIAGIINPEYEDEYIIESVKDALSLLTKLKTDAGRTIQSFNSKRSSQHFPFGIWFRGEPATKTPLTPSIFRPRKGNFFNEKGMIWDVGRRISECNELTSPFDKLCLAQHYLVPTRLLDWTENILIALYFAVSDRAEGDKKLFILNAFALNEMTGWKNGKGNLYESSDYGTIFRSLMAFSSSPEEWLNLIKRSHPEWDWSQHPELADLKAIEIAQKFNSPIAVVSSWTNPRMLAQSSVFTLHGGSTAWEEESPHINIASVDENGKKVYIGVTIPEDSLDNLKSELLLLGIHHGSVYPELDKQREYFESLWINGK